MSRGMRVQFQHEKPQKRRRQSDSRYPGCCAVGCSQLCCVVCSPPELPSPDCWSCGLPAVLYPITAYKAPYKRSESFYSTSV